MENGIKEEALDLLVEYRYVYEFQYEWHAGVEGAGGTFSMSAHAICGHEP